MIPRSKWLDLVILSISMRTSWARSLYWSVRRNGRKEHRTDPYPRPRGSKSKREKHAAPVARMYPSFRSSTHKAFYKRRGWHSELTLEELMARKRGFAPAAEGWEDAADSNKAPQDPWSYLDRLVGRWLPEDPVAPEPTHMLDHPD